MTEQEFKEMKEADIQLCIAASLYKELERLKQERLEFGKLTLENYVSISETIIEDKREIERLRKELTELMSEMHEQLDYDRWAESKGYGYDEYFKDIDNGEWDNVGDQDISGEEKG